MDRESRRKNNAWFEGYSVSVCRRRQLCCALRWTDRRDLLSTSTHDLSTDSHSRAPVSRLAPGYTVYRRPRMADEGVPANAELV